METVKIYIYFVCDTPKNPSGETYAKTRELCIDLLNPNDLLGSSKLVAEKIIEQCLYRRGEFVLYEYTSTISLTRDHSGKKHDDLTDNLTNLLFPEEHSYARYHGDAEREAELKKQRRALLKGFGIEEDGLLARYGVRVWVYYSAPCRGI